VIAGQAAYNLADQVFTLGRYNSDGMLNTGFGSSGRLVTNFSGDDDASQAMVLLPGSRVIVAGYATATAIMTLWQPGIG
jgi:hypothetical protein